MRNGDRTRDEDRSGARRRPAADEARRDVDRGPPGTLRLVRLGPRLYLDPRTGHIVAL